MQFKNTAFVALLAAIPNIVNAAPTDATAHSLESRQQTKETVYLTNCGSTSEFSYYKSGHNSENRSPPDDRCKFTTGNNLPINWEFSFHKCTFGSGVSFETQLGGGVQPNEFIGTGIQRVPNKTPKTFDCFMDNGRILYRDGSVECKAIHWCNPR
ncbi:hypothetical protein COCVIDRAFT_28578 [Bipolaris victoriae FI3]|uniref:AA1-like domain-containing protein n=1 Tax=Bipolaris victoriae (strain FI3) TaxID=930091 RepID=W7EG98_BIPV3|nr:hypothetical protein COCVIDRAFT_28578 [Bipolaris victoriae FI3]